MAPPELTRIEVVFSVLIEGIFRDGEVFHQLMYGADVHLVVVLGLGSGSSSSCETGGAGEGRRHARGDTLKQGHLHVTGEASMQGSVGP